MKYGERAREVDFRFLLRVRFRFDFLAELLGEVFRRRSREKGWGCVGATGPGVMRVEEKRDFIEV